MAYDKRCDKYKEALERKEKDYYGTVVVKGDNENWNSEKIDKEIFKAKQNVHKIAIDCLNEILSPELKIFIRNLCYDRLAYPDEKIFYDVFGKYPKIGDKVLIEEAEKKGIDLKEFESILGGGLWILEGTFVTKEEINGKDYYVIRYLDDTKTRNENEYEQGNNFNALIKKIEPHNNREDIEKLKEIFNEIVPLNQL